MQLRLLLLGAFSCLLISAAEARPRRARPNAARPNTNTGARVQANEQTHRVKVINCTDRYMETINGLCRVNRIAMTDNATCQRIRPNGKVLIRNNNTFVRSLGNNWNSWSGKVTVRNTQDRYLEVTKCGTSCRLTATSAQINGVRNNQSVRVQLNGKLRWSRGSCTGQVRSIR